MKINNKEEFNKQNVFDLGQQRKRHIRKHQQYEENMKSRKGI